MYCYKKNFWSNSDDTVDTYLKGGIPLHTSQKKYLKCCRVQFSTSKQLQGLYFAVTKVKGKKILTGQWPGPHMLTVISEEC